MHMTHYKIRSDIKIKEKDKINFNFLVFEKRGVNGMGEKVQVKD